MRRIAYAMLEIVFRKLFYLFKTIENFLPL